MENFDLISFPNDEALAQSAASAWLDQIEAANRASKSHSVALSGGRITQKFFAAVVAQAKTRAISFARVQFFWADERCVPPNHPDSNFLIAGQLLFAPLKIPENQICRIRGEELPEAAAKQAEAEIRRMVSLNSDGQPILDIAFLGLGEDGHVASLFPGEGEATMAGKAIYRAVRNSPKPPPERVTLGYAAIASAKQVWMFASGAGKERALRESLSSEGKTPFARVLRLRSSTKIFTDISFKQFSPEVFHPS